MDNEHDNVCGFISKNIIYLSQNRNEQFVSTIHIIPLVTYNKCPLNNVNTLFCLFNPVKLAGRKDPTNKD